MAMTKQTRILVCSLAGFTAWAAWSAILNATLLGSRYEAEQKAGHLLPQHPYSAFLATWFLMLFLFSLIATQFYVWACARLGPGLRTSSTVGLLLGFTAAMPIEVTTSRLSIEHTFTVTWIADLVVGATLATVVAGLLYKE